MDLLNIGSTGARGTHPEATVTVTVAVPVRVPVCPSTSKHLVSVIGEAKQGEAKQGEARHGNTAAECQAHRQRDSDGTRTG
ncbi:hypothetical protein [Streptomyces flavofungini]|uniref:hypothetical protein n=1 Tax=Streptomyces flavofungini TaxID=68200 RepID=UPI0034DF09AC